MTNYMQRGTISGFLRISNIHLDTEGVFKISPFLFYSSFLHKDSENRKKQDG